ncbi:MAG: ABC transporter permease [Actinomycetota bacterium]|nr:ABC transporter permease [Actinomycetota bacterium]MDD5668210.1 ABC transporter permease [Actinomycetota bacterium]
MNRVFAIVRKDVAQILRNRFVAVISLLFIVIYALMYYLLPSDVDEVFRMGFYLEVSEEAAGELGVEVGEDEIAERLSGAGKGEAGEGLELVWAESVEGLRRSVEEGEVSAGLSFVVSGAEPELVLYVSSDTPEEVAGAGEAVAAEIGYALLGFELPADFRATVIGTDMAGRQIPMKDRLRVVLISFVLLLELFSLGNLLMEEVQKKTAMALLVTPVTLRDFISAKAVTGILNTFFLGFLLALLLGAVSAGTWLAVVVFLLLGAAMMVGVAFIVGASSRDFISMAMISVIPMVVLIIPGFLVIYPGFESPVLRAIPTYWLVAPLNGILNYGMRLSDYTTSLIYIVLFTVGFFALGSFILRRRLA